MSFGFGVSDFLTGLQLCAEIKERCFTTANRVEVQYRELAVDVGHLEVKLRKLLAAVSKVSRRTTEEALPLLPEEDFDAQTSVRLLEQESKELIGDFNATLRDCREFLDQNRQYESRRAKAFVNFTKGKGFESRVNSLRSRVMFHMQKIQLVILPVQLELLTIIQDRVIEAVDRLHEIIEILRDQMGQARAAPVTLPEVPASLSEKFKSALQQNHPDSYIDSEPIPLKEGFDAIYEHYRHSTLQFKNSESSPQTLEQYLNLLKAHWLLETVKSSKTFFELRPSSLYRQAIAIIEKRIAGQYARSDESIPEAERVTRFGEQELGGLDDAAFAIWPQRCKDPRPTPTKPSPFEEEILKLSLPKQDDDQNRELIFFRASKNVLRLVESRTSNETTQSTYDREFWINVHEDGLVPWYTFGQKEEMTAKFRIGLGNSRGGVPFIYEFESQNDVLKFQRAITGYLVGPPPFENVFCSYRVSKGKLISLFGGYEQEDGRGSIQIWIDSPLSSVSSQTITPWPSHGSSERKLSVISPISYSGSTSMAESLKGTTISITDETSNRTVVAPKITYPSALVAFTLCNGHYTIWFTELKVGMAITETIRGKARIVIRYKSTESKEKPFTTRRISVPENELGDCNLAVFGQPRHPLFENKSVVHELSCDFLSFKFTSTKRMDNFVAHFKFALDNECKRVENIQLADSEAKRQANQPKYAASTRRNSSTERLFGSGKGNLNSKTSTILGSSPPRFRNDPLNKSFRPFSGLGLEKMSEASEFEKL